MLDKRKRSVCECRCKRNTPSCIRAQNNKLESEQVLVIRPTFLGSCSAAAFIGMFLITLPVTMAPFDVERAYIPASGAIMFAHFSGMFITVAFRAYFRGIETMKEDMSRFSIDRSKSFCCDCGHVEAGNRFMCDRGVVKRCVSVWFGSEEAFEDCIRSEVVEKVVKRLQHQVFTRTWSLSVTVPLFWGFCDLSASWFALFKVHPYQPWIQYEAVATLLEGFVIWFLCCPIFVDYTLLVTRRCCRKAASTAGEILKNVAVLLLLLVGFSLIAATFVISNQLHLQPVPRAGTFGGFWCLMALFQLVLKSRCAKWSFASFLCRICLFREAHAALQSHHKLTLRKGKAWTWFSDETAWVTHFPNSHDKKWPKVKEFCDSCVSPDSACASFSISYLAVIRWDMRWHSEQIKHDQMKIMKKDISIAITGVVFGSWWINAIWKWWPAARWSTWRLLRFTTFRQGIFLI